MFNVFNTIGFEEQSGQERNIQEFWQSLIFITCGAPIARSVTQIANFFAVNVLQEPVTSEQLASVLPIWHLPSFSLRTRHAVPGEIALYEVESKYSDS